MSTTEHIDPRAASSARERRLVRRVRSAVAALVAAAATAEIAGGAWPLLLWPMYARTHSEPPARVSEWQVQWVTERGNETAVLPAELYTHVHADLGRRVVAGAVMGGPDRDAYRRAIERRLRRAFGLEAPTEIRIRRLHWTVDAHGVPPYRLCCPDDAETSVVWRAVAATPAP